MKKVIGITAAAIGGTLILLVIIGLIVGQPPASAPAAHTAPATSAPAHTATPVPAVTQSAVPAVTQTPVVTVTRTSKRVTFTVTGTGAPSITYGSDSDNLSPGGTLGPVGDGNALPWHATMRYNPDALYYDVYAQLEGYGNIRCTLGIKVTQYYSDGTHISRGKILQRGHASGGYNICDAQESA